MATSALRKVVTVSEGDAIYRMAATLRTALIGRPMVDFDAPGLDGVQPQSGGTIEEVRSHGRTIELVWDDGVVLETRLRPFGAWHVYRPEERWRRSGQRMRAVIDVGDWLAVCFGAVVESYRDYDPRRHPMLGRIGPDLSREDADLDECVTRMTSYPERDESIAEVLLDQRVMVGLGNVYRCEILWACEIHPWAAIGELKAAECRELVELAAETLRTNRIAERAGSSELAVYGRQGQPCTRCGDLVKVTHHGEAHRVLYWCPGCQIAHEPMLRPNFTPLGVARSDEFGDTHPAARQFMSEIAATRRASGR
jgi:endonuclease-8